MRLGQYSYYSAELINRGGRQVTTKLSDLSKPSRKRLAGMRAARTKMVRAMIKRVGL